ncbi:hypothetical protein [Spartinivicinus ruber]|uniref:hypothetical protein n=1 Tax=Spartinivicinus ruber TaxID=2683272 RepID=UPI0013D2467F|nr:hypothetical protein [Spartinivicinus ruber]
MDKKQFDELLASIHEADDIIKGKKKAEDVLKKLLSDSPKDSLVTGDDRDWLDMKPEGREE